MKILSHFLLLVLCLALSACAAQSAPTAPAASPLPHPKLVEFYSPL